MSSSEEEAIAQPDEASKAARLSIIQFITLAGFITSAFFYYFRAYYLKADYPSNTFLFSPQDALMDFFNIFHPVQDNAPFSSSTSVYPPFAYILLYHLTALSGLWAYGFYILPFALGILWFLYANLRFLPKLQRLTPAVILGCISYPVLFCLDRGNIEIYVFLFLCGFLLSHQKGLKAASILCLSCAAAIKIYPLVFVILFLKNKQWKEAGATLGITILLTLASATCFPGGALKSLSLMSKNINEFNKLYAYGDEGLHFSSNYYSPIKIIFQSLGLYTSSSAHQFYVLYSLCSVFIFLLTCLVIWKCPLQLWQQTSLLCFSMILLPQVSYDYKLIHLLIPIILFINSGLTKPISRYDIGYSILFGLLLIPKSYIILRDDINIGVFINPLLMTLIAAAIILENIKLKRTCAAE